MASISATKVFTWNQVNFEQKGSSKLQEKNGDTFCEANSVVSAERPKAQSKRAVKDKTRGHPRGNQGAMRKKKPAAAPSNNPPHAQRFIPFEVIAKGGFGTVYRGIDRETQGTVAIKKHDPDQECFEIAKQESQILRELARINAPHRLHMLETIDEPRSHAIVTELIPAQNLRAAYLSPDSPSLSWFQIVSIAHQGLEYFFFLMSKKVVHGDVNPTNMIFLKGSNHLTFVDHGLSFQAGVVPKPDNPPALNYCCPEEILEESSSLDRDLWSFGCTLCELITKNYLFPSDLISEDNPQGQLQLMADHIGLPSKQFLERCKKNKEYYELEPEVKLKNRPHLQTAVRYDHQIRAAGHQRQIAPEKIEQFITLIEGMLRYENRVPPELLLQSPLFSELMSFRIEAEPFEGEIVICRIQSVFAQVLTPDLVIRSNELQVSRCYHMIRDPSNMYRIFVLWEQRRLSFDVSLNQGEVLGIRNPRLFFHPTSEQSLPA